MHDAPDGMHSQIHHHTADRCLDLGPVVLVLQGTYPLARLVDSRLSIGQPTVSEQVSGLEKRFSVELFHRRGRFIELSPAG